MWCCLSIGTTAKRVRGQLYIGKYECVSAGTVSKREAWNFFYGVYIKVYGVVG